MPVPRPGFGVQEHIAGVAVPSTYSKPAPPPPPLQVSPSKKKKKRKKFLGLF